MLRAVGAGAAMHATSAAPNGNGGGTLSLLKVWIALETRQFVTSSIEDIEDCVKYDLLSPNI
jgi:aarF domain-containing kinase